MLGQRLRETLYFWKHHLLALIWIAVPFAAASELIQWLTGPLLDGDEHSMRFNLTALLALSILTPLSEAAMIGQLAAIQAGRARSLLACLAFALGVFPMMMLTMLMMLIPVYLGILLLILPGLWIYGRLSLAPFMVVLERKNPVDALTESFRRTEAWQWELMGGMVVLHLLVFMVSLTAQGLVGSLLTFGEEARFGQLAAAMLVGLFTPLTSVFAFRYYSLSTTPPAAQG